MKFDFTLDQKRYKTSQKELIKAFEKYCLQVKGECERLEIISTTSIKDCRKARDIKSEDYEWDKTFYLMLGFGDFKGWWRPLCHEYKNKTRTSKLLNRLQKLKGISAITVKTSRWKPNAFGNISNRCSINEALRKKN